MNQPEELNQFEEVEGTVEPLRNFEQELMLAMRGVDPPAGFTDRVMSRAKAPSVPVRGKVISMPSRPLRLWVSGAIAAALLTGVFFAEDAHRRHQREQAELAQQQFEAGIRITDRALEHTREQLQRAGIQIGD